MIVPFAYFFHHHLDKPTGDKKKYLEDFFWRCSLSARYTSGAPGKLAQDIKRIERILEGQRPNYDWGIDISPEYIIRNGSFSAGRSYIKAILCIYAYKEPKSFNDNSIVNISNYWLKQANSKNYHHFFPRHYMKRKGYDEDKANNIVNITIVDDFLNKREIKTQAPSMYMKKFEEFNANLVETMKTHLILDLEKFGIWADNYDMFIKERAKVVSDELKNRLIEHEADQRGEPDLVDDYDENTPEFVELGK